MNPGGLRGMGCLPHLPTWQVQLLLPALRRHRTEESDAVPLRSRSFSKQSPAHLSRATGSSRPQVPGQPHPGADRLGYTSGMPTLFVVIPVFNEAATAREAINRVSAIAFSPPWKQHIIVVDDGSDESTRRALEAATADRTTAMTLLRHAINRGKGAALLSGFDAACRMSRTPLDAAVIQDADLEYDPHDFLAILTALDSLGEAAAVIGNRWHQGQVQRGPRGWMHMSVNRLLTRASNHMTGLGISDMECCYKAMRISVLRTIVPQLTEQRFGIEPQIVAAWARSQVPLREVPVSYAPRSFAEGKKIRAADGLRALWVIAQGRRSTP